MSCEYFCRTDTDKQSDSKRKLDVLDAFREHLKLIKGASNSWLPLRFKISTKTLFTDCVSLFLSLNPSTILKSFKVTFEGEKGIDSGALTTSLYNRFFSEMLAPENRVFEQRGGGVYLPSQNASVEALKAVGVAISRAIYDQRIAELPLSSAVFKFFYDVKVDFNDLESFDESTSRQLKNMLRCPGVELMDLDFGYAGGNESDIVDDENKEEFVRQKIYYDLVGCRLEQMKALKQGFWSITALEKPLKLIGWRDVIVLLCGNAFISADMILNVLKFEGFGESSMIPLYFGEVLEEMTQDDLKKFLFFVTEQPSIPFGGLCNPRGHSPTDKITVKLLHRKDPSNLPTAAVCFYQLSLPPYKTKSDLKNKLTIAIRESGTSFDYM